MAADARAVAVKGVASVSSFTI